MSKPRFWQLFTLMRQAGLVLTLDQYDLLHQAAAKGYNLDDPNTLKRISRLLWVKPSENYSATIFERTFEQYIQLQPQPETPPPEVPASSSPSNNTPTPQFEEKPQPQPPRGTPNVDEIETPSPAKTAIAAKSNTPNRPDYRLIPTQFPVTPDDLEHAWKALRRPVREGRRVELDLDKTLRRIEQESIFSDLVLRPVRKRRGELLVLIDDSNAMLPFMPMLRPLLNSIEQERITFVRLYRFTKYPDDYLFSWQNPTQAEAIADLLPKLHRNRTLALIISDAGAATRTYNAERVRGVSQFLDCLRPNISQWLWLNPLPSSRWRQTTAAVIANLPGGQMIELERTRLQTFVGARFPRPMSP